MIHVTDNYLNSSLTSNVEIASSNLSSVEQELATGIAINKPSDNPAGTAAVLSLNDTMSNVTQYQTNASSANTALSFTDSQLQSVDNLLIQARSIAVASASTGTQSTADLAADATQVASIITEVTNLANTQTAGGAYIFSGTQSSVKPYQQNDPTHAYAGNTGAMTATLGTSTQMQINTPGSQIFGSIFSSLEGLKSDITSGNSSAISNTDLSNIDAASASLLQTRANIGANIDQISDITTRLGTAQAEFTNQLSSVQDVDIATVYTQLQDDQNVYQASLEATSQAYKYSLADFITTA